MELEALVRQALSLLSAAQVAPEAQWTLVIGLLAAQNGWSLDEASQNFANLLESLSEDEPAD
jgi:opacity protein-like surface antigen